jgi:hypothetical protein
VCCIHYVSRVLYCLCTFVCCVLFERGVVILHDVCIFVCCVLL